MEIAVIGGGHGCHAAAADLAYNGHQVRMWRRDAGAFQPVLERQAIVMTDADGKHEVPLALATNDLGKAIAGAALIVIPLPATAHRGLADALATRLEDGQVVLLPPGTFGSYLLAEALHREQPGIEVAFAESGTLPYLTRLQAPGHVAISVRATRLPTGVFPARTSSRAISIIRQAYPTVEPLTDALDGALMNAGPIIHPPLICLNAGPLEHYQSQNGDAQTVGWDIHKEGTQPSIRRVTDTLDAERIAIREALGYSAPHFPLADHYDDNRPEWMYGNASHARLVDSGDWREPIDLLSHRYMREDVALGLSFMVSAARYARVLTPMANALLAIGSAICGEDFATTGRTFATMGINTLSRTELRSRLKEGFVGHT